MYIESILSSVLGFIVGGLVMIVFGAVTLKFFIRRIIDELMSDKTKGRFGLWIEEVFANSIAKSLKDKKIKKIVVEILEVVQERLVDNKQ